ncbi:MAG: VOC family protein [Gemmatimonadetes bacterium]|nr:VOC family protein [Gemmatimonadota bacterium]
MASTEQDARKTEARLTAKPLMIGLTTNDLQKSLRFYTEGLGFGVASTYPEEGDPVFYALKAGDCELGIGQDDWAKGRDRVKGVGMRLYITTSLDVYELARRCEAAGYKLDGGPEKLQWGPDGFHVTDPDGFKVTIVNG